MTGSWAMKYPICSTTLHIYIYIDFFGSSFQTQLRSIRYNLYMYLSGEALYMVLLPSQSQGAAARPSSWHQRQLHATKATCFCVKKLENNGSTREAPLQILRTSLKDLE